MTISVTARPWETCKALARAAWTRARALTHPTLDHAAVAADLDRSHLSRWESERCDHPTPLAVLWSRDLLSDEALDELVAQARADRALQPARVDPVTAEGAQPFLLAKDLVRARRIA